MWFRPATRDDTTRIAALHADSWRVAYRDALEPGFVEHSLDSNRLQVWRERMSEPAPNQHVILAEDRGELAGFACLLGDDDPVFGTLLDNLHVRRDRQKTGLGRALIAESASWCLENYARSGLYLWVLESNAPAHGFYAHLGANDGGGGTWCPPGGGTAPMRRRAWTEGQLRLMI